MDALRYHLVILAAGEQLVSTGQASAPRQSASQHRTGRATAAASYFDLKNARGGP
jgi:hypothetical protein